MPTDEDKVTRKLRAILSADVKGYSLLMTDDEAYTVRKLEEYRTRMSNLIKANSGRKSRHRFRRRDDAFRKDRTPSALQRERDRRVPADGDGSPAAACRSRASPARSAT